MSASSSRKKETGSKSSVRKDRVAEVANTFEWLITAFILAFMFRAFVMEAFRIPTGSMADTLKGAHFRLRCLQCGYRYDYGFIPEKYGYRQDYIPRANLKSYDSRCPSCGHYQPTGGTSPVANGDRILVLKCIYQFFEPKRWDVVVFKNPLDPAINYIKRLIGRPGESLEIIDGDIYINGQIARKPDKVQDELWMPVYDNDYQPA
ncbi:MAG: signal peptidase I, partial [Planctomycetota bacterium]